MASRLHEDHLFEYFRIAGYLRVPTYIYASASYPAQVCSGAGKALSLMMTGENDLVHDLVSTEMAPGRVVTEAVATALSSL